MNRCVQGFCIVFGSVVATVLVLAAALAWGPHHHCKPAFPMVIGCAMGHYETLTGGMIAAGAALFAGWLAWSAVQVQIEAEAKRAAADRIEVERILQIDLDTFAGGLGAIWKILERFDPNKGDDDTNSMKLSGIIYGIKEIADDAWLSSSRKMVAALGWERRRQYEELFAKLEYLGRFRDIGMNTSDIAETLVAVRSVSSYVELLRPDTAQYFEGRFRRAGKAWTLGYAIEVRAGVNDQLPPK